MKEITFRPKGFDPGASYYAELLLNSNVEFVITDLVEFQLYTVIITEPGTYTLNIYKALDGVCKESRVIQALFPIVQADATTVDCLNNTYNVILTLTNPSTAGVNVQYGWSLQNMCSTVENWSSSTNLIFPADDVVRYIFVKNQSQSCCNLIGSTVNSPCVTCNLDVTNVVFTCNG